MIPALLSVTVSLRTRTSKMKAETGTYGV